MAHFFIGYHGGEPPSSPEEGKALMGKWMKWVQGMGDMMINPGTPLGGAKTVDNEGASDGCTNALMGFSIVDAPDMDAALEIAQGCPHLMMKGATLQVAEMKQMPAG